MANERAFDIVMANFTVSMFAPDGDVCDEWRASIQNSSASAGSRARTARGVLARECSSVRASLRPCVPPWCLPGRMSISLPRLAPTHASPRHR